MTAPAAKDEITRRVLGGHNPRHPRLEPPPRKVPFPLATALERAGGVYYDRHRGAFEALNRRRKGRRTKGHALPLYSSAWTVRPRSDRREAETLVLRFLLARCDLHTRWAVRLIESRKESYTLEEMGRQLGLSRARLSRALADLELGEMIHTYAGRDRVEGPGGEVKYFSRPAARRLTLKAFRDLGAEGQRQAWIDAELRAAAAAEAKAAAKLERRAPVPPAGTLVSTAIDPAIADLRPELLARPTTPAELAELRALEFRIGAEHPEWTTDEVEAEALRRWRPPPPDRR